MTILEYDRLIDDEQQERWCMEYMKKKKDKNRNKIIAEISKFAYGFDDSYISKRHRDPFSCYVSLEKVKSILHKQLV